MEGFPAFPVLFILQFGTPASADYTKGMITYKKGEFATVLKDWKPLAEQMKDGNATLKLGEESRTHL